MKHCPSKIILNGVNFGVVGVLELSVKSYGTPETLGTLNADFKLFQKVFPQWRPRTTTPIEAPILTSDHQPSRPYAPM